MSTAANAITSLRLKRRALSLGAVKAFDNAMQFLLPVVLVRCLDAASFGEYRLLWLAVGTVAALAPLGVQATIFYFLPHSDAAARRLYIQQTAMFLAVTGLLGGLLLSSFNPWLPATLAPLVRHGALVPVFVTLWVVANLLDYLPTAEERIGVQALLTLSTSLLRTLVLAAGAWLTGDMAVLVWLLVAVALFKLALLAGYVARYHGWRRPWASREAFAGQMRYGLPFGVSSALYVARSQADQWVAASLFSLQSFAAFSIGAMVGQIVNIFRASVVEAFFPSMSRMAAAGDMKSAMEMNAHANEIVGWALYPMLAFLFFFADDLVSLVYTHAYVDAAPVMRVYAVGLLVLVIELSSLLQIMRQGVFNAVLYAAMLGIAVAVSWLAGSRFGLPGAAAGSVVALYLDRLVMLHHIAGLTGVPVRRQQHWGRLAWLLAAAAIACALASALASALPDAWLARAPHLVRLACGVLVVAAAYGAATYRRYIAPALR